MRVLPSLALLLALTACGPTWTRSDTSREAAAQDLSECRHLGQVANQRDADIDTDIIASRGQDWQRLDNLSARRADYNESNALRTNDIVDQCMIAKGYAPGN